MASHHWCPVYEENSIWFYQNANFSSVVLSVCFTYYRSLMLRRPKEIRNNAYKILNLITYIIYYYEIWVYGSLILNYKKPTYPHTWWKMMCLLVESTSSFGIQYVKGRSQTSISSNKYYGLHVELFASLFDDVAAQIKTTRTTVL